MSTMMIFMLVALYVLAGAATVGFMEARRHWSSAGLEPVIVLFWPLVLAGLFGEWVGRKLS